MASLDNAGLNRRLDELTRAARRKVEYREHLRERAKWAASLHAATARLGVPPNKISYLRDFDRAAEELAKAGDGPELQRADAAFIAADPELSRNRNDAADVAKLAAAVARFDGTGLPDPWNMSPFGWYAWSLAVLRRGRPPDEEV